MSCKTYCCAEHGCKYSHHNCEVYLGYVNQEYPCEDCYHDADPDYMSPFKKGPTIDPGLPFISPSLFTMRRTEVDLCLGLD